MSYSHNVFLTLPTSNTSDPLSSSGPFEHTDNAVPRFNGTNGNEFKDSAVIIDDSGNITTPGTVDGVDISARDAISVTHTGTSTDNAIARFDGATGKLIQNSRAIMDGAGSITWTQGDDIVLENTNTMELRSQTYMSLGVNENRTIQLEPSALFPVTDNVIDLGKSGTKYKDLYLSGTANIPNASITNSLSLPTYTTVEEDDLTPTDGQIIHNTDLNKTRSYADGGWRDMDVTAHYEWPPNPMTSYTTPSPYVVTFGSERLPDFPAWAVFNKKWFNEENPGNPNKGWYNASTRPLNQTTNVDGANTIGKEWIQIDLGTSKTITSFFLSAQDVTSRIGVFWIVGGNDNTNWTTLYSSSDPPPYVSVDDDGTTFHRIDADLSTTGAYRYYRLVIDDNINKTGNASQPGTLSLQEWRLFSARETNRFNLQDINVRDCYVNGKLSYNHSFGNMYTTAINTATTTCSGAWAKASFTGLGITSANPSNVDFTHTASNRLTYTGTRQKLFSITCTLTYLSILQSNVFQIYKNGAAILPSKMADKGHADPSEQNVVLRCHEPLVNGDYIELYVFCDGDIGIEFMNLDICEVNI